jgi:hypothetical protein
MLNKINILALILVTGILGAETFPVPALPFAPLSYICYKASGAISIDGSMADPDWQNAPWTQPFTDIEGDLKPAPFFQTRMKMLHDHQGLYFFALMEEPHVWASITQRDAVIFHDNDFEIFIDPDGDTHEYYELEINALGTLWDLFIIKPYRDDHSAIDAWDIRGIEYAIHIDGTLNDPSDVDTSWSLEMFIPWQYLAQRAHMPIPPMDGDYWRMNFSRVQWEHDVVDGQYVKVPGKPEYNWVWSPQGLIAMHYPERWGYVLFSGSSPSPESIPFVLPAVEHAKEYLRQLYYRQKQYFMDHGRYARKLRELDSRPFEWDGIRYKPTLQAIDQAYYIHLDGGAAFGKLWIRDDGMLREAK